MGTDIGINIVFPWRDLRNYNLEDILKHISNFFEKEKFVKQPLWENANKYVKEFESSEIKAKSGKNPFYEVWVDFYKERKNLSKQDFVKIMPGHSRGDMDNQLCMVKLYEEKIKTMEKLSKDLQINFDGSIEIFKCLDSEYAIQSESNDFPILPSSFYDGV